MAFELVGRFAVEGGPLFVGDVSAAAHWTGTQPQPPLVVAFGGASSARLPEKLRPDAGKFGQERKFTDVAAARAFADEVIAAFKALHPKAARPERWPDYPAFYEGEQRIFTVEIQASSAYRKLTKKLKGGALAKVLDRGKKASALFVDNEAGRGLIAVDRARRVIAIVGALSAKDGDNDDDGDDDAATDGILAHLAQLSPGEPTAKIALAGDVALFSAAFSGADMLETNPTLAQPLDKTAAMTLKAGLQSTPVGARFAIPAGLFSCAHLAVDFGDVTSEHVSWLSA